MKKIYIAGCGGMLGEAFYSKYHKKYQLKCTDIDVNEDWLTYLDFRDFSKYKKDVSEFMPDALFHIGAYTDLEFCELHPDDTYSTNTMSVENAVYIANSLEIPLIYISTAGIFDGEKECYDDWDLPSPICHYARSKYAGEVFVKEHVSRHLICRAGWMMGGGPKKDKKFIQKIMNKIKQGEKTLYIVNDKLGTPTYTHDFVLNLDTLFQNEYWGIYNMVCQGLTSRMEVAKEMLNILNLRDTIKIVEVDSNYYIKDYFVRRPASERLINTKLELRNSNAMRDWKIALREYLETYYNSYL